MANKALAIPRAAYPEEAGVSSDIIARLIEDIEHSGIETHSLMVIRHGKVAFEQWRKPYGPDYMHIMYSVSKSVTSTAAGFAVSEGLLSLDTRIVDVFPEYCQNKADEDLEKITLHHLLTMTAGKAVSIMADRTSANWVKDYIETKQGYTPGEGWSYINENTYMVVAMIAKLTGQTLTEYLTPRLYEPLGIEATQWERESNGIETGGWGLYLKTEDLAKIALCYLNKGIYNGKQVIPAEWVELAAADYTEHIENGAPKNGYGYFIWGCEQENTYRFDGMFSQFAFVYKDYDAVIVTTSNELDEDKALECIARHDKEMFFDGEAPETVEIPEFSALPELEARERQPEQESKIEGKTIKLTPNPVLAAVGFPLSVLTIPAVYMSVYKGGPMDNIRFNFYEDECTMYWTEGKDSNIIHIGLDGNARYSRMTLGNLKYTACSSAAWLDKKTLEVWIRPLESINQRRLKFVFKGNSVLVEPSSMPTTEYITSKLAPTLRNEITNETLYSMFSAVFLNSHKIIEAPQRGRMK
ncbi:MAG: serine hydrolase [Clostridia bacterium]|nr:serine hydrolase [Clostridia bacterium]